MDFETPETVACDVTYSFEMIELNTLNYRKTSFTAGHLSCKATLVSLFV